MSVCVYSVRAFGRKLQKSSAMSANRLAVRYHKTRGLVVDWQAANGLKLSMPVRVFNVSDFGTKVNCWRRVGGEPRPPLDAAGWLR